MKRTQGFFGEWVEIRPGRKKLVMPGHPLHSKTRASVRQDRIPKDKARTYSEMVGEPVDTRSALRRVMRENDLRFVERGERSEDHRAAVRDWHNSDPRSRGPKPQQPKPQPRDRTPDIRRIMHEVAQRKGIDLNSLRR